MKPILKIWIVAVLAIIPAISNASSGCDQEMTQIKIIRTAGLDIVRLNNQRTFQECVDMYYASIEE